MFRIYDKGDILRAGNGFTASNNFTHIEALTDGDFVVAADLNRAVKNLWENQEDIYSFLSSFLKTSIDVHTILPNSQIPANDTSFEITSNHAKEYTVYDGTGATHTQYYLSIPSGIANVSSGVVVYRIIPSVLERQIADCLGLTDLELESVYIKVQENAGTGNPDRLMCKITKLDGTQNTVVLNTLYFGCAGATDWDDNVYTNAYYNTIELINAINTNTTTYNFRGLLYDKVAGDLTKFRGQQNIAIVATTDYDVFLNQITGLCEVEETPAVRDPAKIYLASVSVAVGGTVTLTDLRKDLSSHLGYDRIPPEDPLIYLAGLLNEAEDAALNEGSGAIEFFASGIENSTTNVFLNGKQKYEFTSVNSYISNADQLPIAPGSAVSVSFFLNVTSSPGTGGAHLFSITDDGLIATPLHIYLHYLPGNRLSLTGDGLQNFEIYVNGKKDYGSFGVNELVNIFIYCTISATVPVSGLVFGGTSYGTYQNAPLNTYIGEIRVYDDLPFSMNYVRGLSSLGNTFINRKNVRFDNVEITGSVTANSIQFKIDESIRGIKNDVDFSLIPSNDANPRFKISEGSLHVIDTVSAQKDVTRFITYDTDFNAYTSNTLRPGYSGQLNGITTWKDITCSWDGNVVLALDNPGYVYVSIDSGKSFKRTSLASGTWGVCAANYNGSVLVACLNGGHIFTSADYGETWSDRAGLGNHTWTAVDCSMAGTYIVVAESDANRLYTSTDTGATWSSAVGPTTGLAWTGLSIYETPSATYSYGCSYGGSIWYSTNAWSTYTDMTTTVRSWTGLSARNNNIYAIAEGSGGGLYRSVGRAAFTALSSTETTWSGVASCIRPHYSDIYYACVNTSSGYVITKNGTVGTNVLSYQNFKKIACSQDGSKVFACSDDGIYYSTDADNLWYKSSYSTSGITGIAYSRDGKVLVTTRDSGFIYTINGDEICWIERPGSGERSWSGVAINKNGTKIAACVGTGYIYTSEDKGKTWTQVASSLAWSGIASDATGQKLAACVNSGNIYVSTNGGTSWTSAASSLAWSSIASNEDGTILLATVSSGSLWVSINSGTAWTEIATTAAWTGSAVSYSGLYQYACNDTAIYRSINTGTSFADAGAASLSYTDIKCSSDGKHVVAGHTTGVIYSNDYGATWATLETGGTSGNRFVDINEDGSIIYVEEYGTVNGKKYFRYNTKYSFNSSSTNYPSANAWAFSTIDSKNLYVGALSPATGTSSYRPEDVGANTFFKELQYQSYYYGKYNVSGRRIVGAFFRKAATRNAYSPERYKDFYFIYLGSKDDEIGETARGSYIKRQDSTCECSVTLPTNSGHTTTSSLFGTVYTYTVSWDFPIEFKSIDDLLITVETNFSSIYHIVKKTTTGVTIELETGNSDTLIDVKIKAVGKWK